jgi:hypothetical protein
MLKSLKVSESDISHVGVAHLEDFQVEHHFRLVATHLRQKLGSAVQRRLRPAYRDRAGGGAGADELEIEYHPQRVHQIGQILWRIDAGDVERAHAHAVEEAVVLGGVRRSKKNFVFERHTEAFGDGGDGLHGGGKISVIEIEPHAAAGEAIVENYRQTVAGGDRGEQTTRITAVVEGMRLVDRCDGELVDAVEHLRRGRGVHRQRPQGIA